MRVLQLLAVFWPVLDEGNTIEHRGESDVVGREPSALHLLQRPVINR